MSKKSLPSLFERHWAESALAIGAVVIAAFSLWVAVDSERTNHQLVAAASWPFVQLMESSSVSPPLIKLMLTNSGIGPAKIETFELFWKGKPQRSPWELLHTCCGMAPPPAAQSGISSSSDAGMVLRAGAAIDLLTFKETPANAASWKAFASQFAAGPSKNISVRYCYCSVLNQCWLMSGGSGRPLSLNPPRVKECPTTRVGYQNYTPPD